MAEPDKKRRLPVLQNKQAAEAEEEALPRPPWHWSAIGVVATFLVWLPLAAAITYFSARVTSNAVSPGLGVGLVIVVLHWVGFLIATFTGGFLIGKFGGEAGPKEGAVSGFVTAALAITLAAASPAPGAGILTWMGLLLVVGGSGAVGAMVGARVGKKRR